MPHKYKFLTALIAMLISTSIVLACTDPPPPPTGGVLYSYDPYSQAFSQQTLTLQPCGYPMDLQGYAIAWGGGGMIMRIVRGGCHHTVRYTP